MAAASAVELDTVAQVKVRVQALLERAKEIKTTSTVEPPLPIIEFAQEVDALHEDIDERYGDNYGLLVIEAAARDIFYSLIHSLNFDDPSYVQVWNLLDILMLCGDRGKCEPGLACSLIEELLDSLTTSGCRVVFDFLESRRERLAAKDFHKKNLVFLRACNELLRRLSRAEDAMFCGRVFFFLFKTFPLGDKSSVNLRGEFHTENATIFETPVEGDQMDVDDSSENAEEVKVESSQFPAKPGVKTATPAPAKKVPEEEVLTSDRLYPIFWRLQQDFSDPVRLFVPENFVSFKKGLAQTLAKFKKTPTVMAKNDDSKKGTKRKIGEDGPGDTRDHFVDNYNPKYLTSKDLFDLELSDLAFQRNIMVQALILIDFLLSLTEKAKKKLAALEVTNKSMLYTFTLGDDDAKWAHSTRAAITTELQSVAEGRFYCRMVDTALARDRNWVRWKVESCPSIIRDPVATELELDARQIIARVTRPRNVPAQPIGAMDLSFLDEGNGGGVEMLKDPTRYQTPTIDELLKSISGDKLDLEFADGEEIDRLKTVMHGKQWRIIRQARAKLLALLDKIDPGKDLEEVLRPKALVQEDDVGVEMMQIDGEDDGEGREGVSEVVAEVKATDEGELTNGGSAAPAVHVS